MSFMYHRFPWSATPTSLDLMDLEKSDVSETQVMQFKFLLLWVIVSFHMVLHPFDEVGGLFHHHKASPYP